MDDCIPYIRLAVLSLNIENMEVFDHRDGSPRVSDAVPESTTISSDESIISTAFVEATGLTNLQNRDDLPFQSPAISSCQPTWMGDSQTYNQDFTVTGNILNNCAQSGTWVSESATGNFVRNLEESSICPSLDISTKSQDSFQSNESILTDLNNFRYPSSQQVEDSNGNFKDDLSQTFSLHNACSSSSEVSDETVSSNSMKEHVEYHTRSGVTRPYSKRRSSLTKRNRINKRERERMHKLCEAFEKLREILPNRKTLNGTEENNGKMSKICTLMMAQRYIQALQDMLDSTADENTYTNANVYVMSQQQQHQQYVPMQEYGYHS